MVMRHVPVVANPVGYRAGGHLIAADLGPAPLMASLPLTVPEWRRRRPR